MYRTLTLIDMLHVKKLVQSMLVVVLLLVLKACASTGSSGATLYAGDQWVILPLTNTSTDASAAAISQSMIEANLRARNVNVIHSMTLASLANTDKTALDAQMVRAGNAGARYGVSGNISQWGRE